MRSPPARSYRAKAAMDLRLRHLLTARFRASPRYGWTPFGALDGSERGLLAGLHGRGGLAGLLRPTGTGAGIKGLDAEAARLWSTLAEPAHLPDRTLDLPGAGTAVARLVLDGVLEVEHEGRFVSGPVAFPLVFGDRPITPGAGPLAGLSVAALEYGGALQLDDPIALSWRLYRYNTQPQSPEWRRRLPDRRAVAAFLGLDGFDGRALLVHTTVGPHRLSTHRGWISWDLRRAAAERAGSARWKLYVSPEVEALPEALHRIVALAPEWPGAVSLKVGSDLPGLLRPDKCVLHFSTRDQLDAAAARLAAELGGMPGQGVPFSAEVAGRLLSWGVDPPGDRPVPGWLGVESWRLWITNRLAAALLAAQSAEPVSVAPAAFALGRILLEGVDPATWAPYDGNESPEHPPAAH